MGMIDGLFFSNIVMWDNLYMYPTVFPSQLLAYFSVLSWPVVIILSGLWQAIGLHTNAGVVRPCLERDPTRL